MAAQDILDSMFPVACAGVQNINKNKDLTEQEVNILYSVVDDFDNQKEKYDWKSAVQTISGVASRFVAKSNSKNNQIAMPLLIQQTIFFMAVRGEDYKLYKQTELMYEFTGRAEYNPKGKYICNNNTTLNMGKIFSKLPYDYKYYRSCRDYKFEYKSLSGVAYSQLAILFSYNGQKDKELGAVIRNLAYQAGKYKHFVDVFGGTGSATLAVPKRGYAFNQRGYVSYTYNDLDERLVNLYNVIKSDDYKILVDEMNQLKLALSYGSTFDESIDFDKEMNKFFTKDTGINRESRLEQQKDSGEVDILDKIDAETTYEIKPVADYMRMIESSIPKMSDKRTISGVAYSKDDIQEKFASLNSDSEYFYAYIRNRAFFDELGFKIAETTLKVERKTSEGNIDELADTSQGSRMRDLQARFYQYYAYFSNVLASGVDTPVRQALAFIFISSMKTNGSEDINSITGIVPNFSYKTISNSWRHFLEPTKKQQAKSPEQVDIIEELHEQFQRVDIVNKDFKEVINDVIEKVKAEAELAKKNYSKANSGALLIVDSPYIATKGYKRGGTFDGEAMHDLISLLGVASDTNCKFIFCCRACATRGKDVSKTDLKAIDKAIVETVYTYFNDIFLANNKPLWVTTISRNNKYDFFEDAVANHKEAEIMITNYKVEHIEASPLYPDAGYEVYTFKDFIEKLGKYL